MNLQPPSRLIAYLLFLIFSGTCVPLFCQVKPGNLSPDATDPIVAISGYYNAADPKDEWTELLVTGDNLDLRNWTLNDDNSSQNSPQTAITFNNIALWNNLRAGTIIMVWHRSISTTGITYPVDADKSDGFIQVAANDPAYFSGGSFPNNTLNVAQGGDLLQLKNGSGTLIHAVGHIASIPAVGTWNGFPAGVPRLNYAGTLSLGDAVFICPGSTLDEYGTTGPQNGTSWMAKGTTTTFGLPNICSASSTANSDFWRVLRQPSWSSPSLTSWVNANYTAVSLTWNAMTDPNPSDGTQGYMVLRNTANTFGTPQDGTTYAVGDNLGGATVVSIVPSSQTLGWTDNTTVPCVTGFYYRVYPYRYGADNLNGNNYNVARGRAYNETDFGSTQVPPPIALAPGNAASDRDNFCEDDPGNITLSATGGSGFTLNWYTSSCGGTLIGAGTGMTNSLTIPSPTLTTTYYARWETTCGNSNCASVTVNVLPNVPVSVTIAASENPVCQGIPVTFTATPVNPGTTPAYQWTVNGNPAGSGGATYTYNPADGEIVAVTLNSNAGCATGNPAVSNSITMSVSAAVPVTATVTASPGTTVCPGTPVIFTATVGNGGTTPSFQWYLNGNPVGTNSSTYAMTPADGDAVYCSVTSSSSCATGNPATSNTVTITFSAAVLVSATVTASPGNVICAGTAVIFTAVAVNGGTTPAYQWYLNGNPAGTNSDTYSLTPADGDAVSCVVTSSSTCATGNPATSNTITVSITTPLPVSVTVSADPGTSICSGTTILFTAIPVNGGANPSYQWTENGTAAGTSSPTYSYTPADGDVVQCTLTSSGACVSNNPAVSNPLTIVFVSAMVATVDVTADKPAICPGTTVTFTATPVNGGTAAFAWMVDGTTVQQGSSPTYTTSGFSGGESVICRMTSSLTCLVANPVESTPLAVPAGVVPAVVLSDQPYLCAGEDHLLDAGSGYSSYQWQDGSTGQTITASTEGSYWAHVVNSDGCTGGDTVLLQVCEAAITIPSAFTPNGDGINDLFRIVTTQEDFTSFSMVIFNRWGELVFESSDPLAGWDGKAKGSTAPTGSYSWKITYRLGTTGDETVRKGTIVLVK